MIHAVFESKNGRLCKCSISGHAGFANAGQDIVCAAVSSAAQLSANLITESFQEHARISAENNLIVIALESPETGNGSLILEALRTHLHCISEEYPKTIKISTGGVKNA